jgi:hypothetical protein
MIEAACVWKAIDAQLPAWFRGDLAQPRPETTPGFAYDVIRAGR